MLEAQKKDSCAGVDVSIFALDWEKVNSNSVFMTYEVVQISGAELKVAFQHKQEISAAHCRHRAPKCLATFTFSLEMFSLPIKTFCISRWFEWQVYNVPAVCLRVGKQWSRNSHFGSVLFTTLVVHAALGDCLSCTHIYFCWVPMVQISMHHFIFPLKDALFWFFFFLVNSFKNFIKLYISNVYLIVSKSFHSGKDFCISSCY